MKLTLRQIGQWLGCSSVCDGCVEGFRQDSRLVENNDLFFALEGERVDGHAYLREVATRGAIAAVVSLEYRGPEYGLVLFRVKEVLEALHELARQAHLLYPCRVIGVTGSVGKTTTKEFIATLIEGSFKVGKTLGNANSQVGMPLSLLNARGEEEVFVVEMGMSAASEIAKLVSIAPPEIALITQVALAHVASFPDGLEGIASAKAEIFSHPSTRYGVMSHQAALFSSCHRGSCSKIIYGGSEGNAVLFSEEGGYVIQGKRGRGSLVQLPFSASHLCENFLGAAVVAELMGVTDELICERALNLKPFSKRFERVEKEGVIFVNDAYNANPTSMIAALMNLPQASLGARRVAVLGAMKELGPYEVESHKKVAQQAVGLVDHLLCFGSECEPMVEVFLNQGKEVELFIDFAQLKQRLFSLVQKGDVVLLKGSNSNQLWRLLE